MIITDYEKNYFFLAFLNFILNFILITKMFSILKVEFIFLNFYKKVSPTRWN